jgi:hypothetical protein
MVHLASHVNDLTRWLWQYWQKALVELGARAANRSTRWTL